MKLKNKSTLFLVVRRKFLSQEEVPIAGFLTLDSADDYQASCEQEFEDKKIVGYEFKVVPVIYYDR